MRWLCLLGLCFALIVWPASAQSPTPAITRTALPSPTANPTPTASPDLRWENVPLPRARVDVLSNESILTLTIDRRGIAMYAISQSGGLYRTGDGANSWVRLFAPLEAVGSLVIDPDDPNVLYAAGRDGIAKSRNGGQNWQSAQAGIGPLQVSALAIDPRQPQTLYAGVLQAGLWRSRDGGDSWQQVTAILTVSARLTSTVIASLLVDAVDSSHVYAALPGASEGDKGFHIVHSRDGGQTWQLIASHALPLIVSPATDSQRVYLVINPQATQTPSTLLRSRDGGHTWQSVSAIDQLDALAVAPGAPERLYASATSGVYASQDGGDTWQRVSGAQGAIVSMVVDPTAPDTLYAGRFEPMYMGRPLFAGVLKSVDGGYSWFPVNLSDQVNPEEPAAGLCLALQSGEVLRLWLGTEQGLYHSPDGGRSWQAAYDRLPLREVRSLVLNPQSGGRMWYAAGTGGVYRSDDGGQSWSPANQGLTNLLAYSLVIDPGVPVLLYVGTGGGVFKTSDAGLHWQLISPFTSTVLSLLLDSRDPLRLYAGGDAGLYLTPDGGHSWQPIDTSHRPVYWLAQATNGARSGGASSLQQPNAQLYAATGAGLFRYATEPPFNSQSLRSRDTRAVFVDPEQPDTIYMDAGRGPEVSADRGVTWRDANLPGRRARAFAYLPGARTLYLLSNAGLFRAGLPVPIGTSPVQPGGLSLITWSAPFSLPVAGVAQSYLELNALLEHAGRLYAATNVSLFASADAGQTWRSAGQGLPEPAGLSALAAMSATLYAGLTTPAGGRVYASQDGSQSWLPLGSQPIDRTIRALAAAEDALYVGSDAQIYALQEDGNTWQALGRLPGDQVVTTLLAANGRLYAGAGEAGLLLSRDRGQSWQPLRAGDFRSLARDPLSAQVIYAAADGLLWLSSNAGADWAEVPLPEGMTVDVIAVSQEPPYALWAAARNGTQAILGRINYVPLARQVLNQASRAFELGDYPGALTLCQQSDAMFKAADDAAGQADAHYWLGRTLAQLGQYQAALEHYRLAATHYETQAERSGETARLYHLMGQAEAGLLDWEAAIEAYSRAVQLNPGLGEAFRDRGYAYYQLGNRQLAEADWQQAQAMGLAVIMPAPPSPWPWLAGLGGIVLLLVVGFFGLAHFSGLSARLLLSQRLNLLQVGLAYRSYRQRWESGTPLQRLLALLVPPDGSISARQLAGMLAKLHVPTSMDQIETALMLAERDGLLTRQGDGYSAVQSPLTRTLQAQHGDAGRQALAEQLRREHPMCANARRFLERAGLNLSPAGASLLFRGQPTGGALSSLLPASFYVQLLPGEDLDGDRVLAIREQARQVDAASTLVLTITDGRASDQAWAQIGTLRMQGFTVLPVESTLIHAGLAAGREAAMLRDEIEKRLGSDYDPYDVRDPVSGAFSFFGRDMLTANILRRIEQGRSVGIFGLRKLGKSSLLQALRDRATFPAAVINLQTLAPQGGLDELYRRILQYWQQWTRARYDLSWHPPPVSAGDLGASFVAATLDLLDTIQQAGRPARLGLFLDEVELVVPRPDGGGPDLNRYLNLMRTLRGLIDEDGRLSLVVASLNPAINRINAWGAEQNPAFSLFQEINLPPLADEDCLQMVRNLGQQVGLVYSQASLEAIQQLSGGHPFLARQLCSLLYRARGRQAGQIEIGELPAGVQRFIHDEATVAHLDAGIWRDVGSPTLWGELATLNQELLLQLAAAPGPLSEHELLAGPEPNARRSALINLEHFHLINRPRPEQIVIRFGLLRAWLRQRRLGLE